MHPFEVCNSVLLAQPCLTLCDPKTVTHQVPLSMEFFRQEYWSGLPFPSPGREVRRVRKKLEWQRSISYRGGGDSSAQLAAFIAVGSYEELGGTEKPSL